MIVTKPFEKREEGEEEAEEEETEAKVSSGTPVSQNGKHGTSVEDKEAALQRKRKHDRYTRELQLKTLSVVNIEKIITICNNIEDEVRCIFKTIDQFRNEAITLSRRSQCLTELRRRWGQRETELMKQSPIAGDLAPMPGHVSRDVCQLEHALSILSLKLGKPK